MLLMRTRLIAGVIGLLLAGASAEASLVSLFLDPNTGTSAENTGAAAVVRLDIHRVGVENILTITIENTTPTEIGSRLTAFGLELPDSFSLNPISVNMQTDEYFDTLTYDHSVSPSWLDAPSGYDLMITSDGNFQGGNPNGAPTAGEVHTVKLSLGNISVLSTAEVAETFRQFYANETSSLVIARFQAVGPDGEDSDMVTGKIPEPATLLLLGFGALALSRRRYRSSATHRHN